MQDNDRTLSDSERQRRRTENLLSRAGQQFNQSEDSNQQLIDEVNRKLDQFEREIPGINDQVRSGEREGGRDGTSWYWVWSCCLIALFGDSVRLLSDD